ncbi:MAG: prolyl oligopeptidase family serine peptidase [Candidatus Delongbacteria bacterium]|nr:prolyl oligopeptidase family serine peptidase [Candidatus Delongbacteria bacterium]
MPKLLLIGLLLFCSILVGTLTARPVQKKGTLIPQRFEKKIKKQLELAYWLFLPNDYHPKSKTGYPMILFLHGAGERGDDLEKVKIHGIPKVAMADSTFPFIVLAPQCPENGWWTEYSDELNGLIEAVIEHYAVDTNRIYITGLSMGGFGTWDMAIRYPHRFAAIAPICGGSLPILAHRIQHLPVWAFHGVKDPVVPVAFSEEMIKKLQSLNAPVKLTLYPDAGHDSWTETYNNPELYQWFLSQKKANQ